MSVCNIGEYIKEKRQRMGLTQKQLCSGICALPTMSRIESGERLPNREIALQLFQRLGISSEIYFNYTTKTDLEVLDLINQARQSYIVRDTETVKELFLQLKGRYENIAVVEKQFCRLLETVLKIDSNELSYENALLVFEDILRMTCPDYRLDNLPRLMSFEEITALNNIAICYAHMDRRDISINIYYAMKAYYENYGSGSVEARITLPTMYFNFSNQLGLSGRYDECVRICEDSIKFMLFTGRLRDLAGTMYNLAWVLVRRQASGDLERAKPIAKQAYCLSITIKTTKTLPGRIEKLLKDYYNEEPPSIT